MVHGTLTLLPLEASTVISLTISQLLRVGLWLRNLFFILGHLLTRLCAQKQQQQQAAQAQGGTARKKRVTAAQLRVQKGAYHPESDLLFSNALLQAT
jgi:hypothetical protein